MDHLNYTQADLDRLRLSMRRSGFGFLSELFTSSGLITLQDEARERSGSALIAKQSANVSYQASIAPLGPAGQEFLFGQNMIDFLLLVSGEQVLPTEDRSCLTFYNEGDHLGPHLDLPEDECMITAILYLAASPSSLRPANTGLVLRVYGQEMTNDCEPQLIIPTTVGALVVGRGSRFWHERPMLIKGEHIAALTGCYGRSIS